MNILYSSNDRYVPIVGVSIISLLENNKDSEKIIIYFIDCGLSAESVKTLSDIVGKYNRNIVFIKIDDLISDDTLRVPNKSYYGRLFGTQITDEDRIMYLDCDLIINSSLKSLYETNLENYWIAGVQGPGASYECRQKIHFPEELRYINTGMLLINLKVWREENVQKQLIEYLNVHGEIPPYHDQNIINAVCYDRTKILLPEYNLLWSMMCCSPKHICKLNQIKNYYTDEEVSKACSNPVIVHFSNSIYGRPWNNGCKHPHRNLYQKYRLLSPWRDENLGESNISKFRKFRNMVYRNVPSYLYYKLHIWENNIIKNVIPKLPAKSLNNWIKGYMNGK